MPDPTILVVAKDHFIGALLGALIELSGRRATFPLEGEVPAAAIARIRPDLLILDCALGSWERGVGRGARDAGSRLLMFSAAHTQREARDIADQYGADSFVLPIKPREFAECLERALGARTVS